MKLFKVKQINQSSILLKARFIAGCLTLAISYNVIGASQLFVGAVSVDISPKLPVALAGQMHLRIATEAATPLTANIIALESRDGQKTLDIAVMVSCDLIYIPENLLNRVRAEVQKQLPGFDVAKIFMNATHTHTAPVLLSDKNDNFGYNIPKEITQPIDYTASISRIIANGIVTSWNARQPGNAGWGLGHAVVGYNRRAVYADGSSVMYGDVSSDLFRNLERGEDHNVNVLFFWNLVDRTVEIINEMYVPNK